MDGFLFGVVWLGTFSGDVVREESRLIRVAATRSQAIWRWEADQVAAQPDRYLSVCSAGDAFPFNRHFFAPIEDLQRPLTQLEVSITQVNAYELHVNVRAQAYAYFACDRAPRSHPVQRQPL